VEIKQHPLDRTLLNPQVVSLAASVAQPLLRHQPNRQHSVSALHLQHSHLPRSLRRARRRLCRWVETRLLKPPLLAEPAACSRAWELPQELLQAVVSALANLLLAPRRPLELPPLQQVVHRPQLHHLARHCSQVWEVEAQHLLPLELRLPQAPLRVCSASPQEPKLLLRHQTQPHSQHLLLSEPPAAPRETMLRRVG